MTAPALPRLHVGAGSASLRAKRALDVTLCLIMLPILLLVIPLCVLAIKLDSPGPAFFTQERTGQHGHRFRMLKFRTMVANAEELKEHLAHLNVLPPPDFKIPNDPRITRVGRFLRKTSLDELPQVLNVLAGSMSLVGPRPTTFSSGRYELWHTTRLEVPPGMTGLWQIRARGTTSFDERLRIDIEYIGRRSLLFDVGILMQTVGAVLRGTGE